MKSSNDGKNKQGRIQLHKEAQKLLQNAQFKEAEKILLAAFHRFEPHVGLLSDICAVQYMNQNFLAFGKSVDLLQKEFEACRHLLGINSYLRTTLTLGKFSEELMLLSEALHYYELGASKLVQQDEFAVLVQKHMAQKLRLLASLGFNVEKISEAYKHCLLYNKENHSLRIEMEHALLLAEMELDSVIVSYSRLKKILNSSISSWEARLVLFDFLEVAMRKQKINEKLKAQIEKDFPKLRMMDELDEYEKALLYVIDEKFEDAIQFLASTSASPFCRLKLLNLLEHGGRVENLLGQYRLLVESLPAASKDIVEASFGSYFRHKKTPISLSADGTLLLGNVSLLLKKNSFPYRIFHLLWSGKDFPIEFVIEEIYQERFSESTFLKLRVSISRLNKRLEMECGLEKCIQIKSGAILLAPNLSRVTGFSHRIEG